MASLHFIITAPVLTRDGNELGRHVTLEVEVEGSAGINSNAGLVRAARGICAGHLDCGLRSEGEILGDFTVTETKEITKSEDSALRNANWPGVTIWRVRLSRVSRRDQRRSGANDWFQTLRRSPPRLSLRKLRRLPSSCPPMCLR